MSNQPNNATATGESLKGHVLLDARPNGHALEGAALLSALAAEFPRSQVSWRAQSVSTKDVEKPKALALAYIDARDVADRLDAVCGVENWQNRYSHADKKTICEIGIRINGEWVWKANGAGDSDVEAEKGALSDAFKRAATMWGIGRYLYDDAFKNVWVPCELYNGKWKKWIADPWLNVCGIAPEQKAYEKPKLTIEKRYENAKKAINEAKTEDALKKLTGQKYELLLADLDGKPEKAELMNLVTARFDAFAETKDIPAHLAAPVIRGAEYAAV